MHTAPEHLPSAQPEINKIHESARSSLNSPNHTRNKPLSTLNLPLSEASIVF
jgi:hypothetical protein